MFRGRQPVPLKRRVHSDLCCKHTQRCRHATELLHVVLKLIVGIGMCAHVLCALVTPVSSQVMLCHISGLGDMTHSQYAYGHLWQFVPPQEDYIAAALCVCSHTAILST